MCKFASNWERGIKSTHTSLCGTLSNYVLKDTIDDVQHVRSISLPSSLSLSLLMMLLVMCRSLVLGFVFCSWILFIDSCELELTGGMWRLTHQTNVQQISGERVYSLSLTRAPILGLLFWPFLTWHWRTKHKQNIISWSKEWCVCVEENPRMSEEWRFMKGTTGRTK